MVIARVSRFIVVCVALMLMPILIRAVIWPSLPAAVWGATAVAIIVRMGQVAVEVKDGWVTVRNFFKTTQIPVWDAEIELGDEEGGFMVQDFGGKFDRGGRMLYLRGRYGRRVHVGVAPRYGKEAERILVDLTEQIQRERIAA